MATWMDSLEDIHLTSVYNKIGKTAVQLLHIRNFGRTARAAI